ncbi:MAG: ATP-binding cassette domain-containing protein [Anaerolineales bacterium]|nr:ATP-binding cassette domain-containing protein [Anaerolineales bacterium]
MIEVKKLVKRFGDFQALHEVSFKAREGEILGFLGPNGAGKTTTMRILTGYMPPTGGTATIAGHDVFNDSMAVRKQIGYLPETVPLYPDMTVQGYLEFAAELRGVPKRKQRIREVLELVGMAERSRSLIRTISKGMRQRVGLAQALIHNPTVLILDEPTIGLDPHQVSDLREFIRSLGGQHTIMFSTHILTEAEQVCDRVVIINKGQIVAEGAPNELRDALQINSRVYVRVQGHYDIAKLAKSLEGLAGVSSVEAHGDALVVTSKAKHEVRPAIANTIAQQGLALLELRPLTVTLEEIFLEYTT